MNYDTSKSQRRAISVLGIVADPQISFASAGYKLEAAGVPSSGIPGGMTWREAGKLSDAELIRELHATTAGLVAMADAMGETL